MQLRQRQADIYGGKCTESSMIPLLLPKNRKKVMESVAAARSNERVQVYTWADHGRYAR